MLIPIEASSFRAGIACVDITPTAGTQLAGDIGALRLTSEVLDPLYARVVVFESAGRKNCIVALDLTLITEPCTLAIRQAAKEQCGLEPDTVMVHATQTHSAPTLGHVMLDEDFPGVPAEMDWIRGGDSAYDVFAVERIISAILEADNNLQPVTIGAGSGIEGRMAFNRRAVMRDGKVFMPHSPWENNPLGPTHLLYMEGPIDPEVGVLAVRGQDGNLLSVLVNYTCHPLHVSLKSIVSADWPGALCAALEAEYSGCISLVINGACGNINPWPPFDPDYQYNGDHIAMGNALTDMVRKVIATLEYEESGVLDWRTRRVPLSIREPNNAQRKADAQLLAEYSAPPLSDATQTRVRMDWMMAASRASISLLRQREKYINYQIQVLRIGDMPLVCLPGEPFVESQLQLKARSPVRQTYVAHCTTQYVGYLPTPEAFPHGGHEVDSSFWAKVEPQALGKVIDHAAELLHDIFSST